MSEVPTTRAEHKQHLVLLDGLRGVAAFSVAAGHTWAIFHNNSHLPHTGQAVDFFFMLSGFVLSYAYREKIQGESWNFGKFMLVRAIRLYPMILAGALLGTIGLIILGELSVALDDFLPTVSTIPAVLIDGKSHYSDPPIWSLFFELLASALFFPAIRFVRVKGWAALSSILGIAFVFGTILTGDDNFGYRAENFGWAFARAGFGFSLGALLYYGHRRLGHRLPKMPWPVAVILLFATFAAPWKAGAWLPEVATVFLAYPLIVLLSAGTPTKTKAEITLLSQAGELSYPIYVLHWPVYVIVEAILARLHVRYDRHVTIFAFSAFLAAFGIAWIALRAYDIPLRRRWSSVLARQNSAP